MMKIACYIGDHAKDDILTRIGWARTRIAHLAVIGRYP